MIFQLKRLTQKIARPQLSIRVGDRDILHNLKKSVLLDQKGWG